MKRSACPRCKSTAVVPVRIPGAAAGARRYKCRKCGAQFKPGGSAGSPSGLRKPFGSTTTLRKRARSLRRPRQGRYMGLLKDKEEGAMDDTEKKMAQHELAIAGDIQENLMPRRVPQIPGYEVSAYYKPCQDVGGDYYDFLDLDPEHVGFLVADVSGKGVPGALVMVATRASMRSGAARSISPKDVTSRINKLLYQDIPRGMFVTMYYIILNKKTNTIRCLSAGHNPMVLFRAATNSCHVVNPNGLALGIDRGPIFDRTVKEQEVQLQPGDRFVIYTDGLVEAMNKDNQEYGSQRLYRKVKDTANRESSEFLNLLVKDLEEFVGEADPHDDLTIVTVRCLGHQDPATPTVA